MVLADIFFMVWPLLIFLLRFVFVDIPLVVWPLQTFIGVLTFADFPLVVCLLLTFRWLFCLCRVSSGGVAFAHFSFCRLSPGGLGSGVWVGNNFRLL